MWTHINTSGKRRVIATQGIPGREWISLLERYDCSVDVFGGKSPISKNVFIEAIGSHCDAVLGQVCDIIDDDIFKALKKSGATVYANYAVGVNNIDIDAANRHGIAIGNTPSVLTDTTAELAVALTFAAARRIAEADRYVREGKFSGWAPDLFLGELLHRKTLGLIGAGRIGKAYAMMMVEGHKMNLIYYNTSREPGLELYFQHYANFLNDNGETHIEWKRAGSLEELLVISDIASIHLPLTSSTHHLIKKEQLELMKSNAILINTSRGAILDEHALVEHCRTHPEFRVGLDVYEEEPTLSEGLTKLDNVVLLPHLGSATLWTRENMALLAAINIVGILEHYPVWNKQEYLTVLNTSSTAGCPKYH